ncbi:MAG TPA: hypothetical protein EYP33_02950, partial [Pyrodictium sp.]|nr:hypothetical protein [Pyrodictium sp.]
MEGRLRADEEAQCPGERRWFFSIAPSRTRAASILESIGVPMDLAVSITRTLDFVLSTGTVEAVDVVVPTTLSIVESLPLGMDFSVNALFNSLVFTMATGINETLDVVKVIAVSVAEHLFSSLDFTVSYAASLDVRESVSSGLDAGYRINKSHGLG